MAVSSTPDRPAPDQPAPDQPWWSGLPGALRSPEAAARLREAYVSHSAADDLLERSPEALDAALASHVDAGRRRRPEEVVVRLVDGRACGAPERHTTVEVVADDMPFLVDSLTAALTSAGRGLASVAHPRLAARRDAGGELLDLLPADAATPEDPVESWIRLELDAPVEPEARPELASSLAAVLDDVRVAVRDGAAMRDRALQAVAELEALAPGDPAAAAERRTAASFLRWLAEDRFTFLGYREYDHERGSDGAVVLVPRPGTELGLLAGPGAHRLAGAVAQQAATRVLRITKARVRSTVHRAAHLDDVSVQLCDTAGTVVGERRLLGLFSSSAASESVRRVPLMAQKVAELVHASGFAPGGHSARDLLSVLEQFPRDELLQADVDQLLPTALGVLQLQERRRTRLFLRRDTAGGFVSCLVFLPRDRWSTAVGRRLERLLCDALDAGSAEHTVHVSESALARLHVVVRPRPGQDLDDPQERHGELEAAVAQAVRSWDDDVLDAARSALGEDAGAALVRRWSRGVPGGYRADVPATRAVDDLRRLDALLDATEGTDGGAAVPVPVLTLRDAAEHARTWRLSLYRRSPVTLSAVLPVLSALGVEVTDERPHLLQRDDGRRAWLYDVGLRLPDDVDVPAAGPGDEAGTGTDELRRRFAEAFAAAWSGRAESDTLDRLVLAAGLSGRQVVLLRALVRYLRQTGLPYSLDYVAATLLRSPAPAALLVRLFEARFDPGREPQEREAAVAAVRAELDARIDAVDGLDADRILRGLLSVVTAALRTNAYVRGPGGEPLEHLAVKLDPSQVIGLPLPVPRYEVWVCSPRVEGVHLRFGAVARGGLRWSDRREDFRTEVLGLVKAQVVKNAVIVPTGAKGGFVGKRLPDPALDRDAWWAEGTACYRTFVSGLLDVTDDLRTEGDRQVVVPPADVVRYDGDDPYLVVAADKGTATFSDLANAIAEDRGFWLGDAFASGGSQGYDHKAMGITARGAWESVRRHFRELGVDPERDEVVAVGIGDMSGDVFGNGMLLSRSLRLVAAFDHRHVFLDPDPDPAVSYEERRRLFALPRSSWADYDRALLSPGGGVHPRTAKAVPVTPQVAVRLGLPEGTRTLSPEALVRAVLRAPVDLLWNGGVGTYVKASSEEHGAVGDRANDAVRVDGAELRVRVVAEGGNLGLTQRGRVEAARAGVRLNNDAVDNSAGVDCSDHEVNIKIALDRLVARGELSVDERNATLRRMTDDVARLVLRHNTEQNTTLSVESALAAALLPAHRRFVESLEAAGALDRGLEALPSTGELQARAREGTGLAVPELSVLLAHAKISLGAALLHSDLPDEAWVRATLRESFPRELVERLGDELDEHPLRREIATTVLVNRVVGSGGITFAFRAAEETGSEPADVVRAWAVAHRVFGLQERADAVEARAGQLPAGVQARLRQQSQRLLDRAVRWFLHERPEGIDVEREVARFAPTVAALAADVPGLLIGQDLASVQDLVGRLHSDGVDEGEARRTAGLLFVYPLLDVTEIAETTGRPAAQVASTWFVLDDRYGFDSLLTDVSRLSRTDRWEALARAALRDDLYAVLREFTTAVVEQAGGEVDALAAVHAWEERHAPAVRRARQTLGDLEAAGRTDLTALSVALRTLRTVVRRR